MECNIDKKGYIVIAVVLILSVSAGILYNQSQKTTVKKISDSTENVLNSADEDLDDFPEDIQDEIDDNTDSTWD